MSMREDALHMVLAVLALAVQAWIQILDYRRVTTLFKASPHVSTVYVILGTSCAST